MSHRCGPSCRRKTGQGKCNPCRGKPKGYVPRPVGRPRKDAPVQPDVV